MSVQVPHAQEAEQAVLGALMSGAAGVADDLADVLSGRDFYRPAHELVWDACMELHRAGERVDPLTVAGKLGADIAKVGGAPYLHTLYAAPPVAAGSQAVVWAQQVADKAVARRLMDAAIAIRQRAAEAGDVQQAAEDARKLVDDAASGMATQAHGISARDLLANVIDDLDNDVDPGVPTGWTDLDDVVGGLRPGQLIVVGARPGVGKSVMAANLAAHTASRGVGVHFASLEMSRDEVMTRLVSARAGVDLGRLMRHQLTEDDWRKVSERALAINDWPLWVDDTAPQSLAQLRSRVRTTMRKLPNLGLVVVDYLQLMSPRDRRVPREQQVGELSEGLKVLAKETGMPVVALAQVNRNSTQASDPRPRLSDLRESGRIEADADQVWLLHRQDLVDPESTTGELELYVAKNRNGPMCLVRLAFQGHYSRAVSMAL